MATLTMGYSQVKFKISSEAAATAITEETYGALQQPTLSSAPKVLCGSIRQSLKSP